MIPPDRCLSEWGSRTRKLRFDDAKGCYEEALDYSPGDPYSRYKLAVAHYKTGEMLLALALVSELHEQLPENDVVSLFLASIHLEQQQIDAAVAIPESMHSESPDNYILSYVLGLAYANGALPRQSRVLAKQLIKAGRKPARSAEPCSLKLEPSGNRRESSPGL